MRNFLMASAKGLYVALTKLPKRQVVQTEQSGGQLLISRKLTHYLPI
jgi:hypothetical protein